MVKIDEMPSVSAEDERDRPFFSFWNQEPSALRTPCRSKRGLVRDHGLICGARSGTLLPGRGSGLVSATGTTVSVA
ncbi:hypothetical protein [Roseibium sp.]|uniref:hypothetical protein n=1 Tax=Roseibium sp. TaxID=1936156 RepID=UPI003A96E5BE